MKLLKGAYDRGLNSWDTANVYSNGVSEELTGKAIKKCKKILPGRPSASTKVLPRWRT